MSKVLLRSRDYRVRLAASLGRLRAASAELETLKQRHTEAPHGFVRLILADRIAATIGHIEGWQTYVDEGCPLEKRATVTANTYAHLQEV